jgi:hypothetical protein
MAAILISVSDITKLKTWLAIIEESIYAVSVLQIISSKLLFPSVDGRKLLIAWHSQEAVQRYPKSIEPILLVAQIPERGWVV